MSSPICSFKSLQKMKFKIFFMVIHYLLSNNACIHNISGNQVCVASHEMVES